MFNKNNDDVNFHSSSVVRIQKFRESNGFTKKVTQKLISRSILIFHTVFCTVKKFQDFSITQILHEINFGDSGSVKSVILTHVEALNSNFL